MELAMEETKKIVPKRKKLLSIKLDLIYTVKICQDTEIEHAEEAEVPTSQSLLQQHADLEVGWSLHLVVKNCQSLPFLVMEVLVELKQMLSDILVRQVLVY